MRYFRDGELCYGIVSMELEYFFGCLINRTKAPSKRLFDEDSYRHLYHHAQYAVVWIHRRSTMNQPKPPEDDHNHRRGNPEAYYRFQEEFVDDHLQDSLETKIILSQPDNKVASKRKDKKGKESWINIHLADRYNICYRGAFKESPITILNLEKDLLWIDSAESQQRASETLEVYFSAILDDNGNPFVRIRFDANLDPGEENGLMQPIEIVGKFFSADLPAPHCLSKNENCSLASLFVPMGHFLGRL